MTESIQALGAADKTVILVTSPDPRSFLPRYLLALAPLLILIISLITSAAISGFFEGFSASLAGPVRNVLSGLDELVQMTVLLTAPVSIYLMFMMVGWKVRITEIWAGSALALGSSSLAGFIFVTFYPDTTLSPSLDLLYWIAYLIGPASIGAAAILIAWAEKFRRSTNYTITGDGLIIRGGVWKRQEHLLPISQIGWVVMEQTPIGRLLHTGTIIPVGTASPGSPIRKGKEAPQVGKEASRHPLDCLYGIRNPEKVMALLEELISPPIGEGGAAHEPGD
jgi:hypothetical protein